MNEITSSSSSRMLQDLPQDAFEMICRQLPQQSLNSLASSSRSLRVRTVDYASFGPHLEIKKFVESLIKHLPDGQGKTDLRCLLKTIRVGGHEWPLALINKDLRDLKKEIINVLINLNFNYHMIPPPAIFHDIYDIMDQCNELHNELFRFHPLIIARTPKIKEIIYRLIQLQAFDQAFRIAEKASRNKIWHNPDIYMYELAESCLELEAFPQAFQVLPRGPLPKDPQELSRRGLSSIIASNKSIDDDTWARAIELARYYREIAVYAINLPGSAESALTMLSDFHQYLSQIALKLAGEGRVDLALLAAEAIIDSSLKRDILSEVLHTIRHCDVLDQDQKEIALEKAKAACSFRYDEMIEDVPCSIQ